MKALMNTKITERILVREHVLKMFDHLNTLKIFGSKIDVESQIDIILGSLPDYFNQFKLNCSMNKFNFAFVELLHALQAAKGIIKGHPSINNVKKTSFFKSFPKGKGKWKKKKVPCNPNKVLNLFRSIGKGKKVNDPKPKGKCFHCEVASHWKRNCPNYLTQNKNSDITESLIIDVSFITDTSNS